MGTIEPLRRRNGVLYPALLIAAIVVIVFSIIGIAIMMGMLPSTQSVSESAESSSTQRNGTYKLDGVNDPSPSVTMRPGTRPTAMNDLRQ